MKKVLVLVSMAAVVAVLVAGVMGAFGTGSAPAVYASRLAGIEGAGKTGIQIQNLDASQQATVLAQFYKQGAAAQPVEISPAPVAAGAAANIYLPDPQYNLPNGAYAAIISADKQIAAIARTEWGDSGGAALYSNVQPGPEVVVPLFTNGYTGQTSIVSIQNTDPTSQVQVTVTVYKGGDPNPFGTPKSFTIAQGTSITLDNARDLPFVPANFLGSLVVTSESTPIGVQSFIDFDTSKAAVYAFEGVPSEMASEELFVPLARNAQGGATTGISVVNPGDTPVNITVSYAGSPAFGTCQNAQFTQTGTVPAGSSIVVYNGWSGTQNGNQAGLGPNPLTPGCLASAKITATGGKILAVVNDAKLVGGVPETSAAYNAVSINEAGRKISLPLYRNRFTAYQLTTGIQAMNVGTAPANASITFSQNAYRSTPAAVISNCTGCTQTIQPGGSYTWYNPAISETGRDTFGSAVIESDQPLAVIVNDISLNAASAAQFFDAAIYNGIKADAQ
jgi:hypothetical protein